MRQTSVRKIASVTLMVFGLLPWTAFAAPADQYPRTANYYLKAGIGIPASDHEKLAKYDVVVLPAEAQVFNPTLFTEVRRMHPDIIILAYIPTKSYAMVWNDSLHDVLKNDIAAHDEWRLRTPDGSPLSVWPNTFALNISTGYAEYLARFTAERVLASGVWDGVFFDEASATISWLNGGNLDLNRDGNRDSASEADRLWKDGMLRLVRTTRQLAGPNTFIVMNGDNDPDIAKATNGRMFETFPTPWEGDGSWSHVTGNYLRMEKQVGYQPLFIINANSNNTGNRTDYKKVRFGLASTLMGDGYFGYDHGDQDHGQFWRYDEMEASLGRPTSVPRNLVGPSVSIRPGVWRRDFERGIAIVNSTDQPQYVELGGDFERLRGSQDPSVNNGEINDALEIPAKDGLILFRPLDRVNGTSYRNGTFVRVLDQAGAPQRNGFYSYTNAFRGGTILAHFPMPEINATTIAARGNHIEAYDAAGNLVKTVYPFGQNWRPNVGFSVGKVGGRLYVAVASGAGDLPKVRAYDGRLEPLQDAFNAYAPNFKGGVNVAIGDYDLDGQAEILTGPGAGGGPHVRVLDMQGNVKLQFFAYDQKMSSGVSVGMGDVDGDGSVEIVTGTGFGAAPHVRLFDKKGAAKRSFYAFAQSSRGGVRVTIADTDGDGKNEILAMSNDVFTLALNRQNALQ